MKYLSIIMFFLLISCSYNPLNPKLNGVPPNTICYDLILKGWDINSAKCVKHLENPKYKIGQKLKIISHHYDPSCIFTVSKPYWNGVIDEPAYLGFVKCDGDNSINAEGCLEKQLRSI